MVEIAGYPALGDYFNFRYYDPALRPGFNVRYGIHAERVVSRNYSFAIGHNFFSTQKSYLYPDIKSDKQYSLDQLSITAHTAYAAMRWYNHSAFGLPAPVGLYHQLTLFGMRYHISDPNGHYPGRSNLNRWCWDGGVGYALGMQRIFWNQLAVNGGIETGLPLGLLLTRFSLASSISLDDPEAKAAARVFFHSLFSLRIGAGWVF